MRSPWPLVCLAAGLAGACGESGRADPPLEVRVSSAIGIEPLIPPVIGTMSAYLEPLAFVPLSAHFGSLHRDGRTVILVQRLDDRMEASLLALAVRHRGLASAKAADRSVVLRFDDEAEAARLELGSLSLALGPYVEESFTAERQVLRRRGAGPGPSRIEIVAMPSVEEEWRRFLGREVDIVPRARHATLRHLREVPSIRVLDAATPEPISLHFHVGHPPFDDLEARRAVALALRRRAIARVVTGVDDRAVPADEDLARARELVALAGHGHERPLVASLVVHDSASHLVHAARVLEEQLALAGIDVRIEALPMDELRGRVLGAAFDVWLHEGPLLDWYRTGDPGNVFGYSHPEVDRALDSGDGPGARELLSRDVVFTPLVQVPYGLALDRRLCADRPRSGADMSWLASVHICGPDEVN